MVDGFGNWGVPSIWQLRIEALTDLIGAKLRKETLTDVIGANGLLPKSTDHRYESNEQWFRIIVVSTSAGDR